MSESDVFRSVFRRQILTNKDGPWDERGKSELKGLLVEQAGASVGPWSAFGLQHGT